MHKNTLLFVALCLAALFVRLPGPAYSESREKTYTNSIGMEFALIPAGSFSLEQHEGSDQNPPTQRKAIISKPFYLGRYQVTQEQWMALMKRNPSAFKGPANPVERISWYAVQIFIERLNAREGHTRYRLPTEMEWELAARGGTDTKYFFMENPKSTEEVEGPLTGYAWFEKNSGKTTHPVGQKKPNPYGLYDICGNVREWVADWAETLPTGRDLRDYNGPASGGWRANRGGSWANTAESCRSDDRGAGKPFAQYSNVGFRLALSLEADASPEAGKETHAGGLFPTPQATDVLAAGQPADDGTLAGTYRLLLIGGAPYDADSLYYSASYFGDWEIFKIARIQGSWFISDEEELGFV
ncbi:MAG: formylglycine-generating enzyme family protein, partial [Deltaproteobacteria bacterium]|nr:formylglycine-generating enzyme family protein [Deltaproteobacteria bacterium]